MSEGLEKEINELPSLTVFQLRTRLILLNSAKRAFLIR